MSKLLEKVLSKAQDAYDTDKVILDIQSNGHEYLSAFADYKTGFLSGAKEMQAEIIKILADERQDRMNQALDNPDFMDSWQDLDWMIKTIKERNKTK